MKLSNKFTFARVIAAPVMFVVCNIPAWCGFEDGSAASAVFSALAIVILACAELTDWLDGHFARKKGEVSDFGKLFDPFADVFLHISMFITFVILGFMPEWCFILIFYREFSQTFFRAVAATQGTAIAARKGGKIKTVFYVASCFVGLIEATLVRTGLADLWGVNMEAFLRVGDAFFVVCVILAYISFADYLKQFGKILKKII